MTNSFEGYSRDTRKDVRADFRALDTAHHVAPRDIERTRPETSGQKSRVEDSLNGLLANKLLSALPDEDFARLLPDLVPVALSSGEDLYELGEEIRFAYFIESAVVSHLHILEDGSTTEATMIGKEGMAGLSALLGSRAPTYWTQVTIGGTALKIETEALRREFKRGGALQQLLLGYASTRLAQLSQRAVCNGRHTVGERLCSWLLMAHDRAGNDQLPLTQEQIARHLGTRRAGVTVAAKELREAQVLSYSRGHIRILDRSGLENAACECYRLFCQRDAQTRNIN